MASQDPFVDPRYEFTAPQYHDFLGGEDTPDADAWFDRHRPSSQYGPSMKLPLAKASPAPGADEQNTPRDAATVPIEVSPAMAVARELQAMRAVATEPAPAPVSAPVAAPPAPTLEPTPTASEPTPTASEPTPTERTSRLLQPTSSSLAKAKRPAPATTGPVTRSRAARAARARVRAGGNRGLKRELEFNHEPGAAPTKRARSAQNAPVRVRRTRTVDLTMPRSPKLHTGSRKRKAEALRSTEELELERIERERREQSRVKRARPQIAARSVMAIARSRQALTEPKAFALRTSARPKSRSTCKPGETAAAGDSVPEGGEFVSTAALVRAYTTKTPKRFRTKPANVNQPTDLPTPVAQRVTVPDKVVLHTEGCQRPPREKSQSEREAEELEYMEAHQFKARPLDRRVLESAGDLGVPRLRPAPTTETAEFHFHTDERLRGPAKDAASPPPPTPKRKVVGAPHLETSERAAVRAAWEPEDAAEPEFAAFKAAPMPVGSPFVPKRSARPLTTPSPFKLKTEERRLKAEAARREDLAEQERQEHEDRLFHARPMPCGSPEVPPKPEVYVTIPTDPHLATEERGRVAQLEFQDKVEREMAAEAQQFAAFKARPVPCSSPIKIHPSTKPLAEIQEFDLTTEERATRRAQFDKAMQRKEAQALRATREKEEADRAKEAEEIKRLRKLLVHKPRPIREGKPIVVKASTAPLTIPVSPQFTAPRERRVRARDL